MTWSPELSSSEVTATVCIDVEPDPRQLGVGSLNDLHGFDRVWQLFQALRTDLGPDATFTWTIRMDPQVARAFGSPSTLYEWHASRFDQAIGLGDEIGLHVHSFRWDPARQTSIVDLADASWIEHCVRVGAEAYRDALGYVPSTFRFGEGFISEGILAVLEEIGVARDMTVEPGMRGRPPVHEGEVSLGSLPELGAVPPRPYQPSRRDLRRPETGPGALALLEIPLTAATVRPRTVSAGVRSIGASLSDAVRHGRRPVPPRRVATLWSASSPPNSFRDLVCRAIRRGAPSLAFAIRTDIGLRPDYAGRVEQALRWLASGSHGRTIRFRSAERSFPSLASAEAR